MRYPKSETYPYSKDGQHLLKNHRRNLSVYRIVSRICERDNTGWGDKLRPAKGLSLLDDVGDPDVVHSFVFGDFTYEKKLIVSRTTLS